MAFGLSLKDGLIMATTAHRSGLADPAGYAV
jgi:hypothetical protein